MNFVLLGAGKTGSIVAEIAGERGHTIKIIEIEENANGTALTRERLTGVDAVIDFTAPHAVLANIEATVKAGCNMVVGTTGWYGEMARVKSLVENHGTGFLWASNFSIGVNLFFDVVRAGAIALKYGYAGNIGIDALIASGLVLFLITLVVNMMARYIVSRRREFSGAN